jgi:alpha-amylase
MTDHNGAMMQFFHWYYPADGSLWKHAEEKAQELSSLGFTSLWLPPAFKGKDGAGASGYDAYDLYDLGEFDQKGAVRTKYGTKAQYEAAIRSLTQQGIGVYADIVFNHKAGADEKEKIRVHRVDPENRDRFIGEPLEIEAYTKFTFPGRNGKYSSFMWDFRCFTGVDYADDLKEAAIFSIINEYGEGWEQVVAREKGNYDYLMFADIEFRNPAVRDELKNWGKWYLAEAPFSGVRLDAVKHMSPGFINEWLDCMRQLDADLFAVGEYWAPEDLDIVLKFLDATQGRISLFDASLHHNFVNASNCGKEFDLRQLGSQSLLEKRPELAVTIVGNHDTQPLQALEAPVQNWFKPLAYAFILLREAGYPCVFYPDLYGAHYVDKGADGNDQEVWLETCAGLEPLLMARKRNAYGTQRDYFYAPGCIGWTREGDAGIPDSGCAVVLSNAEPATLGMEVGRHFAGTVFIDCLGWYPGEVTIGTDGCAEFPVNGGSVSVWVSKK